ncbi:MAG: AI-2E family transporter [Anaerolineae bacterium]
MALQEHDQNIQRIPATMTWRFSWWKTSLVLAVGLFLGLGALALVDLVAQPLAMFLLAITIAAGFAPVVRWLSHWLPRTVAVLLIYLVFLITLVIIGILIAPSLETQFTQLLDSLPQIQDRAQQVIDELGLSSSVIETVIGAIQQFGNTLISVPITILTAVADTIFVLILSLYLLLDAPGIRRFVLSLFPDELSQQVDDVGTDMLEAAGGWVRGVVIDVIIVGIIVAVGLTIIGLPFALVLGVMAGLFEILPIVGSLLASIPVLLVALLQSPTTALITLIFFLIVQQIEGNLLAPNIMHDQAKVPQFLVLFAILVGGAVGGILGALVAIPLAAALRVFVVRVIAPFIRQQTGAAEVTSDS